MRRAPTSSLRCAKADAAAALVAEVATAWLIMAADHQLLQVARRTEATFRQTVPAKNLSWGLDYIADGENDVLILACTVVIDLATEKKDND